MRRKKSVVHQKKQDVFNQLNLLCREMEKDRKGDTLLSEPHSWPKTRELADRCGETIYMTRNILLQLVNEGKVIRHSSLLLNSLRWYVKKNDDI